MYSLELDLHLTFSPPMSDHGLGLVLTRTVELPFPPHELLRIHGRLIDETPEPEGLALKNVVWDMDRRVFVAETRVCCEAFPFREIVDVVREWLGRGWTFGSYRDKYRQPVEDEDHVECTPEEEAEQDRLDGMHQLPPNRRPKGFNLVVKALVRLMAETFDQSGVAYAMDKTGVFHWERDRNLPAPVDPLETSFIEAKRAFDGMGQDEQFEWRDSVMKYPSIEDMALGKPVRRQTRKRKKKR